LLVKLKIMKQPKKKSISLKKITLLFILYSFIYLTVFAFIDYYAYYAINPYLLTILSVLLGAGSTYVHVKKRYHTYIDHLVKKLED